MYSGTKWTSHHISWLTDLQNKLDEMQAETLKEYMTSFRPVFYEIRNSSKSKPSAAHDHAFGRSRRRLQSGAVLRIVLC